MANMGYCRFQNTLSDLKDCLEHIEEQARKRLIRVCRQILEYIPDEEK